MAKYSHANRQPIDDLIHRWREQCLVGDSSLLYEGESIWTQAGADELYERFNQHPLEGKQTFIEKLREQLEPASQPAVRLMAEVVVVYFLFASSVSGRRKREVVSDVLAISGDGLGENNDVFAALETGIGGAGQAFNSYRPVLVAYLVAFTRRFKAENGVVRREVLGGPQDFKQWLVGDDDQADGGEQMMRQILLHLLFPEHYERIASGPHKHRIRQTFEGLVEDPDDDIDRCLLQIRERLNELLPDGQVKPESLDFYEPPLREAWGPEEVGGDDTGLTHLAALQLKRQVILYGPPGTGKTFEAKELARRLIHQESLVRWGAVEYFGRLDLVDDLAEKQTRRLQLHQAWSYEDFIRGLRLTKNGTEPRDGYLLQLIRDIDEAAAPPDGLAPLPWVLMLDEVNRVDLSRLLGEAFSLLENREEEVELPALEDGGAVRITRLPEDLHVIGTMNLIDQSVEQLDFALRRRFLWLESRFKPDVIAPVVEQRWDALGLDHHPWERIRPEVEQLAEHAEDLNARIRDSPLLGEQYEIGHTYFFDIAGFIRGWDRVRPRGRRPSAYLWKSNGDAEQPMVDLWQYSLRPLLAEYLAGSEPGRTKKELASLRDAFIRGASSQ